MDKVLANSFVTSDINQALTLAREWLFNLMAPCVPLGWTTYNPDLFPLQQCPRHTRRSGKTKTLRPPSASPSHPSIEHTWLTAVVFVQDIFMSCMAVFMDTWSSRTVMLDRIFHNISIKTQSSFVKVQILWYTHAHDW